MSNNDPQIPSDEWLDLLVRELTDELTPAEREALASAGSPELAARYRRDLDRAAGAIALAVAETAPQPLPPALRSRLEAQAAAFVAPPRGAPTVVPLPPPREAPAAPARAATRSAGAGWWAAAACLLLAAFAWFRAPQTVFMPAPPSEAKQSEPTAAMLRAALLTHPDVVTFKVGATKDPAAAGLTGDVVWDPATQQGFIRLVGLQANDPKVQQYQLWIFDGERDQRYPVDGGVFDSAANGGEVLVPIHAAVPVHVAKAFAVTVEKPGGVVVSARDRVVALAQAS